HVGIAGAAMRCARAEEVHGFQQVRLAGRVGTRQQHDAGGELHVEAPVIPKGVEAQFLQVHGAARARQIRTGNTMYSYAGSSTAVIRIALTGSMNSSCTSPAPRARRPSVR